MDEGMFQLGMIFPDQLGRIMEAYNGIHHHYRHGLDRDGPDAYHLSRELEKLARKLRRSHFHMPWLSQLGMFADQLKYMGRDMQIGRRRRRYYPMPKERYMPWLINQGYYN
jgi:hypothetical protein